MVDFPDQENSAPGALPQIRIHRTNAVIPEPHVQAGLRGGAVVLAEGAHRHALTTSRLPGPRPPHTVEACAADLTGVEAHLGPPVDAVLDPGAVECTRAAGRRTGRVFLHEVEGGHWLNTENPKALQELLAAGL